jgi:hypothetical protein
MARKRVRGDVGVRGAPVGRASPEYDDLGGLVLHAGPDGDLLREDALSADVHEIGRNVRVLVEKCFDLVQGRDAAGSGGAVLVEEGELG